MKWECLETITQWICLMHLTNQKPTPKLAYMKNNTCVFGKYQRNAVPIIIIIQKKEMSKYNAP